MDKRTLIFIVSLSLALFGVKYAFQTYEAHKRAEWLKTHPQKASPASKDAQKTTPSSAPQAFTPSTAKSEDEYYVLENNFQQLVFSSRGAALVEINLPFKTKQNSKSVVLPIEFDRELAASSPKNARFPFFPAKLADGTTKEAAVGGYYPLLRRSEVNFAIDPKFYALNVVSEYPEVAELQYSVKSFTNNEIVFEATQPHRRITKRYSLLSNPGDAPYCFQLEIKVEGDSRGLWLTSGVPEVEWISGAPGTVVKYHVIRGDSATVEKVDLPKELFTLTSVSPDWICNSNGFFGVIIDPSKGCISLMKNTTYFRLKTCQDA
jgi:YidC/Oxa1 family membrane protein insertase